MSDLISILMPVFNAAPWLGECLRSIRHQSWTNWELIAVDDHSTDGSLDLLKQTAEKETRMKVFQNRTKGIIPALQLALEKSAGNCITRMDADDVMAPQKLALLHQCLSAKGPGYVATGRVRYFSKGPLGDGYRRYEQWLNQLCENHNHYDDIYRECVIPSPCWMTYRDDLLHCGAFDADRYPEDYDLCFRFYQNGLKVACAKNFTGSATMVLHHWRDHPGRASRTNPTYADHRYLDLKLYWFLQLDYTPERPLVLWGAGKKGKLISRKLKQAAIPFFWVTNNLRKQGVEINGIPLTSYSIITTLSRPQVVAAVAAPVDQQWIKTYWEGLQKEGDIWFFC